MLLDGLLMIQCSAAPIFVGEVEQTSPLRLLLVTGGSRQTGVRESRLLPFARVLQGLLQLCGLHVDGHPDCGFLRFAHLFL